MIILGWIINKLNFKNLSVSMFHKKDLFMEILL